MSLRALGPEPLAGLLREVEDAQRRAEARAIATRRRLETLEARQALLERERGKERESDGPAGGGEGRERE